MERIEEILIAEIKKRLENDSAAYSNDIAPFSDNFAELIEKLIILHIRIWKLEDLASDKNIGDSELANIKRKLDVCFKIKRPQLLACLNLILDEYIRTHRLFAEPSIKKYGE